MRRPLHYILEGHDPVACDDPVRWAEWFATADRRVDDSILPDGVRVSTVFFSLDIDPTSSRPLLFETMIIGGPHDGYGRRAATWAEAEFEHQLALTYATRAQEGERKMLS